MVDSTYPVDDVDGHRRLRSVVVGSDLRAIPPPLLLLRGVAVGGGYVDFFCVEMYNAHMIRHKEQSSFLIT